jgi:DNA-binding transcriptional ArsR family regulator
LQQREQLVVSHPLSDDLIELIAERFSALSEPTRVKLLDRLRGGEATVLELTELVGTTPQNISKHLGVLRRAGIVARRRQGTSPTTGSSTKPSTRTARWSAAASRNRFAPPAPRTDQRVMLESNNA